MGADFIKKIHLSGVTDDVTGEAWIAGGFLSINVYDKHDVTYPSHWVKTLNIPVTELEELLKKELPR